MTEEQRSSQEARARAELAVQGIWSGALQIHCVSPLLVVEYFQPGFAARSSSAPLTASIDQWVDSILALIHDATTSNPALPSLPLSVQPSSNTPPATESSGKLPAGAPAPSAPVSSQRAQSARPSTTSAPVATGSSSVIRPATGIGMCTEFWLKPGNSLLGPCAAVGLRIRRLWRMTAMGGVQWAAAQTGPIAIRNWDAGLDVRYGRAYWLAIGSQLSALQLVPHNAALPAEKTIYAPSLLLRVGLSQPFARRTFTIGTGLKVYSEYHDVMQGSSPLAVSSNDSGSVSSSASSASGSASSASSSSSSSIASADTNGDGFLSLNEFTSFLDQLETKIRTGGSSQG